MHGGWATRTKLKTHKEFSRYTEVPAYVISPWVSHPGSHVDKALLIGKTRPGDGRAVAFGAGVIDLGGWVVAAPVVAEGGTLTIEVGWGRGEAAPDPFRPLVVLTGPDGATRV